MDLTQGSHYMFTVNNIPYLIFCESITFNSKRRMNRLDTISFAQLQTVLSFHTNTVSL